MEGVIPSDVGETMRFLAVFAAILLGASASVLADVIHLTDGTTREGQVVSQTEEVVVLEMVAAGVKARMTIKRADIDRIELKPTEHQLLEAEYKKRVRELDETDADAVIRLAKWCTSQSMFKQAEDLLVKLAARGGQDFVRGEMALANIEYERKRFEPAKQHLKAVLDKHPDNLDAKLLRGIIEDEESRAVERLLLDAIDEFNRGRFDAAVKKAESFHDRATLEQGRVLLAKTTFPEGMTFEEFTAEARLRTACPFCKEGTAACRTCVKDPKDADGVVCPSCGGTGRVVCERCGGTGVKLGEAPDWQTDAMVRGLERRVTTDAVELDKTIGTLTGKPREEEIIPTASRAELLTARTLTWLSELEKLTEKKPGVTTRPVADERRTIEKQFRDVCLGLGDHFANRAQTTWQKVEGSEAGYLSQDTQVREARGDATRAVYFYNRTREREKDPYPPAVAAKVAGLEPLVAQLDKIIDHNGKLLKAYELALKHYRRGNLQATLTVLVDLVTHAARFDLDTLSTKVQREFRGTLREMMAGCRFELGKEKGEFGETTEYERPAFVNKLISEADAASGLAHNGYETMLRFRDRGQRNRVPTSLVRRTRESAEDARRWYRAVFEVPYPLRTAKRTEIDEQIEYMTQIINHCKRWYSTGGTTTVIPPR